MPQTITEVTIDKSNAKLTETMFPGFKDVFKILRLKEFKGTCVPDVPVSSKNLRSLANVATLDSTAKFLLSKLADYKLYLTDLLDNVTKRFTNETMIFCTSIGKILNFDSLYSVDINELSILMNPRNIQKFQDDDSHCVVVDKDKFFDIINSLPFVNQIDKSYLCVQYNRLIKFVYDALLKSAARNDDDLTSTVNLLKRFVNEFGQDCPELVHLLSLCVSFPVSEAIVESWGSTISHYFTIKHSTTEPINDLKETGTVDKLTYIKLCGPPPGRTSNRRLLKAALHRHFKSDYAQHFVNSDRFDRATSKVVTRILNPVNSYNILPCFQ